MFGKPGKGGISGLKMDLNANIGLTFTPIEWANEQKHILSAIPQGKSVFITGSAGTGKTLLLEEIKKLLKKITNMWFCHTKRSNLFGLVR
ncbi:MAG: hypothetical protein EOQ44_36430, partial [Mesorhizobium sp.]